MLFRSEILDREVPGMAEAMRAESLKRVPAAMLSRAVAGIRGKTLIVNLPGSPGGARENLAVLLPTLPHAIDKIRGTGEDCAAEVARSCREGPRGGTRGDGCA